MMKPESQQQLANLSERYKVAVAKLRQSSFVYVSFADLAFILDVVRSPGEFVGFARPVETTEWHAMQEMVERVERLAEKAEKEDAR